MRRQPVIKLKCAQTFMFKSRCKYCKSGPKYVFFLMNRYIDEENISALIKYYNSNYQIPNTLTDERYLESTIKNRIFRPSYMFDFNTMYFRKLIAPNSKYKLDRDKFTTILECECAATTWAFINSRREHIKNRKNVNSAPWRSYKSLYKVMI
jgi:hypothetical protein